MKTGAGLLDKRVRFDRRITTDDGEGNHVSDFAPVMTVWARIKPLTGGEQVVAERLTGLVRYEITVRGSSQARMIAADWRAIYLATGKTYNIRAIVNPDERGAYLIMTADDGPVDG